MHDFIWEIRDKGNPILKAGPWGNWDNGGYFEGEVYFKDGIFHMFYGGAKLHPIRISSQESIGYAYSFDGINFTKHPNNPLAIKEMQPEASAFAEVHVWDEGLFIYLYHTLRYYSQVGAKYLGGQVLAKQRPFKLRMPILLTESIAPGKITSLENCQPLCLDNITTLSLTCEAERSPNAHPFQIHVKSSYDGIKYETVDMNTFVISSFPVQQIRQTFAVTPHVKYIKVQVENTGKTDALKKVSVCATLAG